MKKLFGATAVIAMLFTIDALVLTKTVDAGVTCSRDFYGNLNCVNTSTGLSSRTTTDFYGNDNTTFSNGSTMSCRTDFYGNYVCN